MYERKPRAERKKSNPSPPQLQVQEPRSVESAPPGRAAAPAPPAARTAVIVCHGMGGQLEYETLAAVARGLAEADRNEGNQPSPIDVRKVDMNGETLQRAELRLGGGAKQVHLYEAYWAPFTEGKVTLRDVAVFFLRSGWRALRRSGRMFHRWSFGKMREFPRSELALFHLVLSLAVIVALFVVSGSMATAIAVRLTGVGRPGFASDATFRWMTLSFVPFIASALLWLLLHLVATSTRDTIRAGGGLPRTSGSLGLLQVLSKVAFFAGLVFLVVSAAYCLGLLVASRNDDAFPLGFGWPMKTLIAALWVAMAVLLCLVRRFLIQYAGDVAAYVYSFALDRFHDLRSRIKQRCRDVALMVYRAEENEAWIYDRIVFVGHSLGSVICYDTINRLIVEDGVQHSVGARARTRGLLTFASPLDKIAFVFATGSADQHWHALVAAGQPMLEDCALRQSIRWVNVFAPRGADIIGSSVDLYDNPDGQGCLPVENVADEDARVFLAAHTEHWDNVTVWDELYGMV